MWVRLPSNIARLGGVVNRYFHLSLDLLSFLLGYSTRLLVVDHGRYSCALLSVYHKLLRCLEHNNRLPLWRISSLGDRDRAMHSWIDKKPIHPLF